MSYLIYIKNQLIESYGINFARTLQVNDIGNITNRNSSFTQTIKIPRTAKNKRIFEQVYNNGNQSNLPYQKASCDIIDADTGKHVVYKGWAILLESTATEYSITVYDGVIDFYNKIANLTITECGVSELNHVKNLENVIETWTDESLPYRYIIADYNGNNFTSDAKINIDFQVPSAKVSYLWSKIFDYVGFNYTGSIFGHEYFQNLWMSYPKPVSQETPEINLITEQDSELIFRSVEHPNDGGVFYGSTTSLNFLPDSYTSPFYSSTSGALTNGLFRFYFEPAVFTLNTGSTIITSTRVGAYKLSSVPAPNPVIFTDIENGNYLDIFLNIGDKVIVQPYYQDIDFPLTGSSTPTNTSILTGQVFTSFNYISGFSLGFDEAFIDFKVSDFIKEIVTRFGLTMFKDKYSNTIDFKTTSELLQGTEIINLSDKFNRKVSEKYTFGSYAKRNTFSYKYNDDESSHNDGYILIDNQNLGEEISLLTSKIYSPEKEKALIGLTWSNVYKIWDKEIKDDESVAYKGLDGRFYFLRAQKEIAPLQVGSTILGSSTTVNSYFRENYNRLNFQNIVQDFYAPIQSIFDKAKLITCEFWFKKYDIANFDFSKLYFIPQLSSYYLVNKINNFVEGKATKVELIEVDYMTEIEIINPPNPSYDVVIGTPVLDSCSLTMPITTDYPQPANVIVNVYGGTFDVFLGLVFNQIVTASTILATLDNGEVTFSIEGLPFNALGYRFGVTILTDNAFISFQSNLSTTVILDGSCYDPVIYPTTLTLNSAVYNGRIPNYPLDHYRYTLNYTHTGIPSGQAYILYVEFYASFFGFPESWNNYVYAKVEGAVDELTQVVDVQGIYTQPTKMRIRIELVTSNEITL